MTRKFDKFYKLTMMILTFIIVWILWHWKCCGSDMQAAIVPQINNQKVLQPYVKRGKTPEGPKIPDSNVTIYSDEYETMVLPYSYPHKFEYDIVEVSEPKIGLPAFLGIIVLIVYLSKVKFKK